jgi:hypothetical protein
MPNFRPPDANFDATIALTNLYKVVMVIISFEINYWREVDDETVWDELLPDVAEIVELVEEFVNASSPSPPPGSKPLHSTSLTNGGNQVIFNLDIGLIVPLYFVVGKGGDHGYA